MKLQHITATNTNTLHYRTLRYTNYITLQLHYNRNYHYIALHDTTQQLQLHYFTLQYARLHYTVPRYSAQHYSTLLHCTNYTTPQLQLQLHYATLVTLHDNYNLQLQLRHTTPHRTALRYATLRYTTLHYTTPALHHATSRNCGEVTTASIATTPKNIAPTTFLSYKFPIFETSTTFLCATTGMLHVSCYFEHVFFGVTLVLEARQTQ